MHRHTRPVGAWLDLRAVCNVFLRWEIPWCLESDMALSEWNWQHHISYLYGSLMQTMTINLLKPSPDPLVLVKASARAP